MKQFRFIIVTLLIGITMCLFMTPNSLAKELPKSYSEEYPRVCNVYWSSENVITVEVCCSYGCQVTVTPSLGICDRVVEKEKKTTLKYDHGNDYYYGYVKFTCKDKNMGKLYCFYFEVNGRSQF